MNCGIGQKDIDERDMANQQRQKNPKRKQNQKQAKSEIRTTS